MSYTGDYTYGSPYGDEAPKASNPCRQFLSNACDTTLKKAAWITGGIVGGGLLISNYWWVPALANAVAATTTTTTTTPDPSKLLIENAVEVLNEKGSLPLEMAQALTPEEAKAVAKKYRNNVIPISSEDFEKCVNLKLSEWPSYMDRVANPLSKYAAWNQLANIAQRPFDQYGSLRSAGKIAQYGALSKKQIGDLLGFIQNNGALGMRFTINNTPIDVTCSRVAEAAQKLTQCPDAWNAVKQAAKINATPSCYQELVEAAKAGHNLGNIINSNSFSDEEIKGAMNTALEAGKLGLVYQVNGQTVPYACYAVLRKHASMFNAQAQRRFDSQSQAQIRTAQLHPMVANVYSTGDIGRIEDFANSDGFLSTNNAHVQQALQAGNYIGQKDQYGSPGFFMNIGGDRYFITSPSTFWYTVNQYRWRDGRFVKLQTAPPVLVNEAVAQGVENAIQKGEEHYGKIVETQEKTTQPPTRKTKPAKPTRRPFSETMFQNAKQNVNDGKFVYLKTLQKMSTQDIERLLKEANRSSFYIKRNDGKWLAEGSRWFEISSAQEAKDFLNRPKNDWNPGGLYWAN